MLDYFMSLSTPLQTTIISAIVALVTSFISTIFSSTLKSIFDNRSLTYKLEKESRYEQKKQLRKLIVTYKGRMLEASVDMHDRLMNLYANHWHGWLSRSPYYQVSTIYRFLRVISLARLFEKEAVYIDSQVGSKKDIEFVMFLKALHWMCTDVNLFKGTTFKAGWADDYFFRDQLRMICDTFNETDCTGSMEKFQSKLHDEPNFVIAANFFLGMSKGEPRFRWDRVVAFHLVLIAFINMIGYDYQKTDKTDIKNVIWNMEHDETLVNFPKVIRSLKSQKEVRSILRLIKKIKKSRKPIKKADMSNSS